MPNSIAHTSHAICTPLGAGKRSRARARHPECRPPLKAPRAPPRTRDIRRVGCTQGRGRADDVPGAREPSARSALRCRPSPPCVPPGAGRYGSTDKLTGPRLQQSVYAIITPRSRGAPRPSRRPGASDRGSPATYPAIGRWGAHMTRRAGSSAMRGLARWSQPRRLDRVH